MPRPYSFRRCLAHSATRLPACPLPLLEDCVDYGAAYFALDAATRGGHAGGFGELALDFGDAQGATPRETEAWNFSIAHIRITFLVNQQKDFFTAKVIHFPAIMQTFKKHLHKNLWVLSGCGRLHSRALLAIFGQAKKNKLA